MLKTLNPTSTYVDYLGREYRLKNGRWQSEPLLYTYSDLGLLTIFPDIKEGKRAWHVDAVTKGPWVLIQEDGSEWIAALSKSGRHSVRITPCGDDVFQLWQGEFGNWIGSGTLAKCLSEAQPLIFGGDGE